MEYSKSLVLIDSGKIRKKAVKELNSTIKKIDSAKLDKENYFQESKPAFQIWYNESCGDLIQKIQKLEQKYKEKEWEVREVFAYAEFHQIPPAMAYLRIQERKNTPEEEREFDPFYDEEEKGYWEEDDEEDFYEEENNDSSDRSDETGNGNHSENRETESDTEDLKSKSKKSFFESKIEELTSVFRKIARVLHPDKNPDLSQEEKENWLEALKFYQEKNLDSLKDILTWIHIKREDGESEISISEIQSLTKKFKKDLKSLQKELRVYKKRPDWAFKKKTKQEKKRIQKDIEEELQSEFIMLHMEMEKLDRVLLSWKQYSQRSRRYS